MALMGTGVLANWGGVLPDMEESFNAWHSLEHLAERLAVPGFLRGRRGIAVTGDDPAVRYLMMYEVADPAVLVSAPYLARLNDPTSWTQRILAAYVAPCRTVCRIRASFGRGLGGWCGTVTVPTPGAGLDYEAVLDGMVDLPGIVGVHALEGDAELGQMPTAEKKLRESQGAPDKTVGAAFLVEGYDGDLVGDALYRLQDRVREVAAGGGVSATLYQIQHVMGRQD